MLHTFFFNMLSIGGGFMVLDIRYPHQLSLFYTYVVHIHLFYRAVRNKYNKEKYFVRKFLFLLFVLTSRNLSFSKGRCFYRSTGRVSGFSVLIVPLPSDSGGTRKYLRKKTDLRTSYRRLCIHPLKQSVAGYSLTVRRSETISP
jgi:hypothetical protein